jgi:hypothetical protein
MWLKVLLVFVGLAVLYALVRLVRAALRFKRSFDDFSAEAGERLLRHAEQMDSTLERWHEYDEAYQEAVARLEEGEHTHEHPSRGVTLGPGGGSLRKPN